jgi:hypothetical protein
MLQPIAIKDFLGLNTGEVYPPGNSAGTLKNFVRHKVRGRLDIADGYGIKYAGEINIVTTTGGTPIEVETDVNHGYHNGESVTIEGCDIVILNATWVIVVTAANKFTLTGSTTGTGASTGTVKLASMPKNDSTLLKVSNISYENVYNFRVNEHGGKDVTVVVATYRKTGFFPASPTTDRFGIFVRPYWNGSVWVEAWRELTEMFVFELRQVPAGVGRLFVDDGTYNFKNLAGYVSIFNSSYFINWTLMFGTDFSAAEDDSNYLLVTGCDFDGADDFYFDYYGNNDDLSGRAVGDKVVLYRGFANKELPSSLTSYIYNILGDLRLTSGNDNEDVGLFVGMRNVTRGWATADVTVDRMAAEVSMLDIWRNAFGGDVPLLGSETAEPMDAGEWYVKHTAQMDDGSETELRNIVSSLSNLYMDRSGKLELGDNNAKCIVNDGTYAYVGLNTNPGKIVKIVLSDMSIAATLELAAGENSVRALVLTGGYLYAGLYTTAGMVVKINPTTMAAVSTLTLNVNEDAILSLATDDTVLMVGCDTNPARIVEVSLATFTRSSAVVLNVGETSAASMQYVAGSFFVGTLVGPSQIVQVTPTPVTRVTAVALIAGENNCYAMAAIGTDLYCGLGTTPGKIVKIDATAPNRVSVLTLDAGENDIRSMWTDGTYIYCGLALSPARVVKTNGNASRISSYTLRTGENNALGVTGLTGFVIAVTETTPAGVVLINTAPETKTVIRGTEGNAITVKLLACPATLPKRSRYINTYVSNDNVTWYLVKQSGLRSGELTWDGVYYFHDGLMHNYIRSAAIEVNGADWTDRISEATAWIDRAITDTGVIKYTHASAIGGKVFASGVRIAGELLLNKIVRSALRGDGGYQYDVFANDLTHIINIEYFDGDAIVCTGQYAGRLLVLKKRSAFALRENNNGGYDVDIVTKQHGICSLRTLCSWDDALLWMDYAGSMMFNSLGIKLINARWQQEWKDLTTAEKEAAIAVIDRKNRQYRVAAAGKEWTFDLDDGEWMVMDMTDQPVMFAEDVDANASINFISNNNLYVLGNSIMNNGGNVALQYETNKVRIDIGDGYDALLQGFTFKYESDVNVTVDLFLDNEATAISSYTLSSAQRLATLYAPLGCRCKEFKLRLSATVTAEGQKCRIVEADYYRELMPVGGDTVNV